MKKSVSLIAAFGALCACLLLVSCGSSQGKYKLSWEPKNGKYENFTDLGNYVIKLNDVDYSQSKRIVEELSSGNTKFEPLCTTTCKRNKKGEVIFGRNMDLHITQYPVFFAKIKGGKYNSVVFQYSGNNGKYKYSDLDKLDADKAYVETLPYRSCDGFNEKGLYIECNMREIDEDIDMICSTTNPDADFKASTLCLVPLVVSNASTVKEALDYIKGIDWHAICYEYKDENGKDQKAYFDLAFMIGDATGEYGLIEFGFNKIYFTPYANGQGNFHIAPELNEYETIGSGYGRLGVALQGLMDCETEQDMMHNMENCMWRRVMLEPDVLGYSDEILDVNIRRAHTREEMHKYFVMCQDPYREAVEAFYAGNDQPLRDVGSVWTSTFNIGVNCAKKHLILRLFENDNYIIDYQW